MPETFKFYFALRTSCLLACLAQIWATHAADVTLAWDRSPDSDVVSYAVYYAESGGSSPTRVEAGNSTSLTLAGLISGQTYTIYAVSVSNSGLESHPSNSVTYSPQANVVSTSPSSSTTTSTSSSSTTSTTSTTSTANTPPPSPPPPVPTGPILTDGSFESGLSGWSVSGAPSLVNWVATDGTQALLFLDMGTTPVTSVISQTFATVSGRQYSLSFDIAAVGLGGTAPQEVDVIVAGNGPLLVQPAVVTPPAIGIQWQSKSFSFVADSSSTALYFGNTSAPQVIGPILDNVKITAE